LPQGFSIACSTSDLNTIIVTTPMGTTIRRDSATLNPKEGFPGKSDFQNNIQYSNAGSADKELVSKVNNTQQQQQQQQPTQEQHIDHHKQIQSNTEQQPVQVDQEQKQSSPAEFNQAINYVNKIKQRYAAQPDIYKLFLENLQMYQKGLKPINEVYREISVLFRDAPNLLEDFKLFMPDNTIVKEPQPEYSYPQYYPQTVQLPPVGNFQSGPYQNAPLNQQQYQLTQQGQPLVNPEIEPYAYQQQQYQQQVYQQDEQLPVKEKKKKGSVSGVSQTQTLQNKGQLQPHDEFPVSNLRGSVYDQSNEKPTLIAGVLEPVYPKTLDTDLSNEIAFFDKVKKSIGNKQTYNEFLKLLKLYSSDVIDKSTLHEKAKSMIGSFPELFEWFNNFIGWEESPLRIENIAIKKQQLDLLMCKAAGPSYRQLPKSQTKMPCSGRDDLCWSILNDEWVGHPVWASEESGFIAHRKNQYEEMLFRIEDERHEYDYFMEANLRTIQTLETIANRMANMTPEEKAKFKLPVGLGHTSSTIYVKVIRKIYDKDRGWEVIDSLHENPAITVPIVLKRLKQKDEEWKRVHREWNKVWREAEQKLMIKSLDHLGLSFKNIDKKLLTNKQLVSEISTIKQEQANKKLHPLMTRPKKELATKYEDFSIFMDILKLVNTNLKHNQVYSQNDKEKMETFMKSFMVKFFFMNAQYIDFELKKRGVIPTKEEPDHTTEIHKEDDVTNLPIPTLSQTKKRPREYDLLKDVLRKNKRKKNEQSQSLVQQQSEQDNVDEDGISEEVQKAQSTWISNNIIDSTKSDERNEFNMFANTQIYVFYRHLDTLYKRLLEIKKIGPEVNKEVKSRVPTKFADDLGLIDHHLENMGISIKGDDSYAEALELCVKLIDNKIEQSSFEESLRNGFRNKAFKLFTIDRVIQSLMKHCHTIVSDFKCSEILLLMEKDRNQSKTSTKEQILYRVHVRSFMNPDENMFKITYDKNSSSTKITFLALDDLTIKDENESKENKWKYYLTGYSMSHPTEGLDTSKINLPFLKSQIESEQDNENEIEGVVDSKLAVKVDMDTYRMRFEPASYDLFIRNSLYSKSVSGNSKVKQARIGKLVSVINGEYGIAADLKGDTLALANEKIEILKEKGPEEYLKFNIAPVSSNEGTEKKEEESLKSLAENVTETATAIATETEATATTTETVTETKTENKTENKNENKNENNQKEDEVKHFNVGVPGKVIENNLEEVVVQKNDLKPEQAQNGTEEAAKEIAEVSVVEGDSTIQQDETVEKVDF
jgi:paired amphipathic helix protein Sin3a